MKSIKIKIPEPCHEDWAKMTKEAKGRFCGSCEKVVHDMSRLTDNEIVSLVKNGEKICGRFRNDQLDRPMYESVPYKSKKRSWAIAASLLVGLNFIFACGDKSSESSYFIEDLRSKDIVDDAENKRLEGSREKDGLEISDVLIDSIIVGSEDTVVEDWTTLGFVSYEPQEFLDKPLSEICSTPTGDL